MHLLTDISKRMIPHIFVFSCFVPYSDGGKGIEKNSSLDCEEV